MPGRSHTGHASWLTTDKPPVTADVAREQLLAAEVDCRRGRAFPVYTMRIVQGPRQWPDASEPDKSAQLRFVLLLCVGVEGSALGDQRGRAGNAVCRTVGSSASAAAIVHQQRPTPLRAVGRVPLAPLVFWSRSGRPCPSAVSGLDESNSMKINRAKQVNNCRQSFAQPQHTWTMVSRALSPHGVVLLTHTRLQSDQVGRRSAPVSALTVCLERIVVPGATCE